MLIVLGALGITCGLCVGVGVWVVPADALIEQLRGSTTAAQLDQLPPGWTLEQLARIAYTCVAVLILIGGVVLVVLGLFVRRGGRAAIVTGIVLCSLLLLWMLGNLLFTVAQIGRGATAQILAGTTIGMILLVCVVLALTWLVRAARAAPMVAWQRQQMQARYWQYQQQAGYVPGTPAVGYGYGYAAQSAPQQQAPVAPAPDAAPPPSDDPAPDAPT
jgi:hypothetical protein